MSQSSDQLAKFDVAIKELNTIYNSSNSDPVMFEEAVNEVDIKREECLMQVEKEFDNMKQRELIVAKIHAHSEKLIQEYNKGIASSSSTEDNQRIKLLQILRSECNEWSDQLSNPKVSDLQKNLMCQEITQRIHFTQNKVKEAKEDSINSLPYFVPSDLLLDMGTFGATAKLVHHWPFRKNVLDVAGHLKSTEVGGKVKFINEDINGRMEQVAQFKQSYLELPPKQNLFKNGEFTISVWVNLKEMCYLSDILLVYNSDNPREC